MLGPTNLPLLSPTELHLGIGPVAIPTGSPLQAVVDHTGTLVCLVSFRLISVIRCRGKDSTGRCLPATGASGARTAAGPSKPVVDSARFTGTSEHGLRRRTTAACAATDQISVCSEISSASSTSMPRYLTVDSSLECPRSSWTARRFLVRL